MSKIRVGNKQNSYLNGEWAKHARGAKKFTSKIRRKEDKKEIKKGLKDKDH